jgi:hypothetical protein
MISYYYTTIGISDIYTVYNWYSIQHIIRHTSYNTLNTNTTLLPHTYIRQKISKGSTPLTT